MVSTTFEDADTVNENNNCNGDNSDKDSYTNHSASNNHTSDVISDKVVTDISNTISSTQTVNEASTLVSLNSFKIKNDGIKMLESELKARGIAFNDKKKQIKPLKNLLKKSLNGIAIFKPISIEIRDAIRHGDIETEEN